MPNVKGVLAGAVVIGLAATALQAEDLTSKRTQLGRGTTSKVGFDRGNLTGDQPILTGQYKGPPVNGVPSDLSAVQMQTLSDAVQHIRDLRKRGLVTDDQIINGDPTRTPPIPGLTAAERAVLGLFGIPGTITFARAATAIIRPGTHQAPYYAFDIDRILNNESQLIPSGLLAASVPDMRIPVKPVRYERVVSNAADTGLTGGWTENGTSTSGPHYRVLIPEWAVRSNGELARDPDTGGYVKLQLLGPGNWFNTRPSDLPAAYTFNPSDSRFRVAISTDPNDQSSPNPFLSGGHIHCYWIYDFGNAPNCHAAARTGDPTAVGGSLGGYDFENNGYGQYGSTIVVKVNNRGQVR